MPEVVEPEILDLRTIDGTVERVLDVGYRLTFKLSFQMNKDGWLRLRLEMNLVQLQ